MGRQSFRETLQERMTKVGWPDESNSGTTMVRETSGQCPNPRIGTALEVKKEVGTKTRTHRGPCQGVAGGD